MGRLKSRGVLFGSDSLSPPSKPTTGIFVASTGPGGGAFYHLRSLGLAFDCGANPNGGAVGDSHMAKLIESSTSFPIKYQLVSHFHLDHHGGLVPMFTNRVNAGIVPLPRVICSDTTWKLLGNQLRVGGFIPDGPKQNPLSVYHVKRTKHVTPVRNKHSVPGSEGFHVKLPSRKTIFYTGDSREFPRIPERLCRPDLCILDCTGAQKMEPTAGRETLIRKNIMALAMETLESSSASVYVSTFSTQLERICWLERELERSTGYWPSLAGTSFLVNVGAYRRPLRGWWNRRFVLCSGVWGQPGSKLVRMSQERYMEDDYRLKPGDRVMLSGSMPTWNPALMADVSTMCQRLTALGAEVIVDSSLEASHMPGLRRADIHCSGHASFLEIIAFLKQLRPKSVFATHGSADARGVIEDYCRSKGIHVVSMNSSSEIILA